MATGATLRSLDEARELLAARVRVAAAPAGGGFLRLAVPVAEQAILPWLCNQRAEQHCFWSDRLRGQVVAGVGECDRIWHPATASDGPGLALREMRRRLRGADPQLRYYGGMAFAALPAEAPDEWHPYGVARFVVPRLELAQRGGQAWLVCNLRDDGERPWAEEAAAARDALAAMEPSDEAPPAEPPVRILNRQHQPDAEGWRAMFAEAMEALAGGDLDKVVLARASICLLDRPISPTHLLRRLAAITPDCFHFCFQVAPGQAFLGATPELLCERHGRHLRTEAIAGTRRRGHSPEEDEALAQALLESGKDRREHQLVVDSLIDTLGPLCDGLEQDSVGLLKLARIQHLCVHMSGELHEAVSDSELLAALHPTPAVGGWPTDAATVLIRRLEPFHRGWYAGPIGWIGADSLQLGVGIRCGRLTGDRLNLYSGAGLVQDSEAEQEWQEIEDKVTSFLSGLLES